ncbi:hypothetical protein T07_3803 [Trichinella nelsoni]|uniref:Uncharacterized protein n=1 Tax=Trichinella nelsoni TaxID=6336 RepID=A0A0V0RSY4_9BILA|nr:hypothetical protein T07_3803 [Trichinella nelsoni]
MSQYAVRQRLSSSFFTGQFYIIDILVKHLHFKLNQQDVLFFPLCYIYTFVFIAVHCSGMLGIAKNFPSHIYFTIGLRLLKHS